MALAAKSGAAVASSTARGRRLHFARLLCPSLKALAFRLNADHRIVGLDVTASHLALSLSDRNRRRAYAWGLIARSGDVSADANAVMQAVREGERLGEKPGLNVGGMVVGWRAANEGTREGSGATLENYVKDFVQWMDQEEERPVFESLAGVVFYAEVAAIRKSLEKLDDFRNAASLIPHQLENLRKIRYKRAMDPKVLITEPSDWVEAVTRISASDILQASLDEIASSQRRGRGTSPTGS